MPALRVLDLFCKQGGASAGYAAAGMEPVGVDIEPQPRYPWEFYQGDALEYLDGWVRAIGIRANFDLVHASPPCQHDCTLNTGTNAARGFEHPDLLEPTLTALQALGLPWVLEQPPGKATAKMATLYGPPALTLCGEMFGLGVIRHRNFWLGGGFEAAVPEHKPHRGRVRGWRHGQYYDGPYVAVYGSGGGKGNLAERQAAMGIDWMDDAGLVEAIPPAYTEYIGREFIAWKGLEHAAA